VTSFSRCLTTPQFFVDGKFIGGESDCRLLHSQGQLIPLLDSCGESHVSSAIETSSAEELGGPRISMKERCEIVSCHGLGDTSFCNVVHSDSQAQASHL
jgi:hypothetical protein